MHFRISHQTLQRSLPSPIFHSVPHPVQLANPASCLAEYNPESDHFLPPALLPAGSWPWIFATRLSGRALLLPLCPLELCFLHTSGSGTAESRSCQSVLCSELLNDLWSLSKLNPYNSLPPVGCYNAVGCWLIQFLFSLLWSSHTDFLLFLQLSKHSPALGAL